MEYGSRSRNIPAISVKHIGTKLEEQISTYFCSGCSNRLVRASILGEEETIRKLRPKKQEINHGEPELYGMAPLHLACSFGHRVVVGVLLEFGADIGLRVEKTISKETPLHIAAGKGHAEIVAVLLAKGADPNSVASNHLKTPLHVACSEGNLAVVDVLLQGGATNDVARPTTLSRFASWCSPLHLACQRGHLDIVKTLLRHGANIDIISEDPRGISVLHDAVCSHQVEIVKYLIDKNVSMNVFDSSGFSPLHVAAKNGYVDMINLLLQAGTEADSFYDDPMHTPLISSITSGKYDSTKSLLEAGAKVDGVLNDAAPLYQAIRYEPFDLSAVELLISFRANEHIPDEIGYYPLHCAAHCGHYDIVDFFLQRGHDPNQISESPDDIGQCETALHCAVFGNNPSVLRLLVKAGVSVNSLAQPGRQTPIYNAILNQKIEMIETLIELDAAVNVKDASDTTPLHHAIVSQNDDIVRMLFQKGACLEAETVDGLTPLHIAVIDGREDSVKLLIDSGASVNVTSVLGETPLHFAAELNYLPKVGVLLQNDADVNAGDCNGTSPLHLASGKGYDGIVELLCKQSKSNVDDKDCSGVTPLHLAVFNGHKTVVRILLEAGADRKITFNGESVVDICCRRRFKEMSKLLKEFPMTGMETSEAEGITQPDSASLPMYLQSVLKTDGIGQLSHSNEARYITETVTAFIKGLLKAVGEFDPRFISEVTLSGSNAEVCKVGEPDEFDFMCYMPTLAENFELCHSPDDLPGYSKVKLKEDRSSESVKDLLKDGTYLFPQRIKACLFSHIEDMFLLNRVKVPPEIRCYLEEFMPECGKHRIVSENKPGFILYFEWRQGLYTGMKITADVIPTLPFSRPKLAMKYTTQSRDVLSKLENSCDHMESVSTCYLIPKPIQRDDSGSFENVIWRISTSQLETKIFQEIPDCKRNTYVLGKILLEQTGKVHDIDRYESCEYYIHTYLLKTVFLHELARVSEDTSWTGSNIVNRLLHIFGHLKEGIDSDRVFSFFIDEYNILLGDNFIAEKTARIWIIDAILLFLSGQNDARHKLTNPRRLTKILHSLRPESISSK